MSIDSKLDHIIGLLGGHNGGAVSQTLDGFIHKNEVAILTASLIGHMARGAKINAIKCYRELTGVGLKEAKDAIETVTMRFHDDRDRGYRD